MFGEGYLFLVKDISVFHIHEAVRMNVQLDRGQDMRFCPILVHLSQGRYSFTVTWL